MTHQATDATGSSTGLLGKGSKATAPNAALKGTGVFLPDKLLLECHHQISHRHHGLHSSAAAARQTLDSGADNLNHTATLQSNSRRHLFQHDWRTADPAAVAALKAASSVQSLSAPLPTIARMPQPVLLSSEVARNIGQQQSGIVTRKPSFGSSGQASVVDQFSSRAPAVMSATLSTQLSLGAASFCGGCEECIQVLQSQQQQQQQQHQLPQTCGCSMTLVGRGDPNPVAAGSTGTAATNLLAEAKQQQQQQLSQMPGLPYWAAAQPPGRRTRRASCGSFSSIQLQRLPVSAAWSAGHLLSSYAVPPCTAVPPSTAVDGVLLCSSSSSSFAPAVDPTWPTPVHHGLLGQLGSAAASGCHNSSGVCPSNNRCADALAEELPLSQASARQQQQRHSFSWPLPPSVLLGSAPVYANDGSRITCELPNVAVSHAPHQQQLLPQEQLLHPEHEQLVFQNLATIDSELHRLLSLREQLVRGLLAPPTGSFLGDDADSLAFHSMSIPPGGGITRIDSGQAVQQHAAFAVHGTQPMEALRSLASDTLLPFTTPGELLLLQQQHDQPAELLMQPESTATVAAATGVMPTGHLQALAQVPIALDTPHLVDLLQFCSSQMNSASDAAQVMDGHSSQAATIKLQELMELERMQSSIQEELLQLLPLA